MTVPTWNEVIQLLIVAASFYAAWRGHRNSAQIQDVHLSIDGRMDELLKASNAVAHAAGVEQERKDPTN